MLDGPHRQLAARVAAHQHLLSPLDRAGLRQAIQGPAQRVDLALLSRSIASLPHAERVNALASDDLLSEACARVSRNLTAEEWRQYLRQEPCRETCPNLP